VEIVFIRHAEPMRDGSPDPGLTDLGRRQVAELAAKSASWPKPTEVLVSPTLRARETAAPLCAGLGLEPTIAPWLEEIRFDKPIGFDAIEVVPDEAIFRAFEKQVTGGLEAALRERGVSRHTKDTRLWQIATKDVRLMMVGHGGANAIAVEFMLGIPRELWTWYRFSFVHTAVTRIKAFPFDGKSVFSLIKHGDVSHLSQALRSH
jgi:broad specificity phosphatase PhoE